MNKERLLAVAEAIKNDPDMYDQMRWGAPWCGSAGCIAGWVVALFGDSEEEDCADTWDAESLLGITKEQGVVLFDGMWPSEWLPDAISRGIMNNADGTHSFEPNAEDAQRVLHKIVKGDITL